SRQTVLDRRDPAFDFTDLLIGMRDRCQSALPDRLRVIAVRFKLLKTYFDYIESRIHPIKALFYRIESLKNAIFELFTIFKFSGWFFVHLRAIIHSIGRAFNQ